MKEDLVEFVCLNMEDGRLVFEPREALTEDEKERANLHVGVCPACKDDMEFDYLIDRMGESNSRW